MAASRILVGHDGSPHARSDTTAARTPGVNGLHRPAAVAPAASVEQPAGASVAQA